MSLLLRRSLPKEETAGTGTDVGTVMDELTHGKGVVGWNAEELGLYCLQSGYIGLQCLDLGGGPSVQPWDSCKVDYRCKEASALVDVSEAEYSLVGIGMKVINFTGITRLEPGCIVGYGRDDTGSGMCF